MRLHSPRERGPVGGHLQRPHHRRADPARPARRVVPARARRRSCCGGTCSSTAWAACCCPFPCIKVIDLALRLPGGVTMARDHPVTVGSLPPLCTVALGLAYPAARHRHRAGRSFRTGEREHAHPRRDGGRLGPHRAAVLAIPGFFWGRPSATTPRPTTRPRRPARTSGRRTRRSRDAVRARVARAARGRSRERGARAGRPRDRLGERARPAHLPGRGLLPGARASRGRAAWPSRTCAG